MKAAEFPARRMHENRAALILNLFLSMICSVFWLLTAKALRGSDLLPVDFKGRESRIPQLVNHRLLCQPLYREYRIFLFSIQIYQNAADKLATGRARAAKFPRAPNVKAYNTANLLFHLAASCGFSISGLRRLRAAHRSKRQTVAGG
ncbi:MAG TPA: hypothetical protein VLB07_15875 [Woeseiaceae bacterium]|nr:hypothetical protein [Woeseiaceae bacterium]